VQSQRGDLSLLRQKQRGQRPSGLGAGIETAVLLPACSTILRSDGIIRITFGPLRP
jgi:hypothetical protein